mmetsp:Transcript_31922/g.95588  ORF Transcript_31922/g.95588 Transcript_31922/m.95588 type:complete len:100 (+) Transcript_31922:396-695(+)
MLRCLQHHSQIHRNVPIEACNSLKAVRCEKLIGIVPVKELRERNALSSAIKLPISVGNFPLNIFPSKVSHLQGHEFERGVDRRDVRKKKQKCCTSMLGK